MGKTPWIDFQKGKRLAKTLARYRGHLALRAKSWKKSRKMSSRGLSTSGSKKSQTESKKSQNRPFFNYFDSFSTPFSTFWALGPRDPGNSFFRLFFQLWARRAQMTPVAGPGNPSKRHIHFKTFSGHRPGVPGTPGGTNRDLLAGVAGTPAFRNLI